MRRTGGKHVNLLTPSKQNIDKHFYYSLLVGMRKNTPDSHTILIHTMRYKVYLTVKFTLIYFKNRGNNLCIFFNLVPIQLFSSFV